MEVLTRGVDRTTQVRTECAIDLVERKGSKYLKHGHTALGLPRHRIKYAAA